MHRTNFCLTLGIFNKYAWKVALFSRLADREVWHGCFTPHRSDAPDLITDSIPPEHQQLRQSSPCHSQHFTHSSSQHCLYLAACGLVAKVHDWEGWRFKPRCSHDMIHAAVGPLSKTLNLALLQGGLSPAVP